MNHGKWLEPATSIMNHDCALAKASELMGQIGLVPHHRETRACNTSANNAQGADGITVSRVKEAAGRRSSCQNPRHNVLPVSCQRCRPEPCCSPSSSCQGVFKRPAGLLWLLGRPFSSSPWLTGRCSGPR